MRNCFLHERFEEPNSSRECKDLRKAPEHFLADCGRNLRAMLALDTRLWTGSEEEMET